MKPAANTNESSEQAPARFQFRLALKLVLGAVLVVLAVWLGRDFGHHLPEVEKWIGSHGPVGWLVFIAALVVLTSVFFPDTVFAIIAGVLFGVAGGTALVVVGSLLTATVNFGVSRLFLRDTVRGWLGRSPKLAAIERAVNREGLRFQFLLRLTPINPVTISYVLGATNTRFATFITACLGLIPVLFVEVYFGYVAKHVAKVSGQVSEHSTMHTALTIAGLVVSIALLVYVTRLARHALTGYENAPSESDAAAG
jgi:uncharacterized membrane protein YdjX (TVP38/TMEM64 family)